MPRIIKLKLIHVPARDITSQHDTSFELLFIIFASDHMVTMIRYKGNLSTVCRQYISINV